jgi:hypothetical protein
MSNLNWMCYEKLELQTFQNLKLQFCILKELKLQ